MRRTATFRPPDNDRWISGDILTTLYQILAILEAGGKDEGKGGVDYVAAWNSPPSTMILCEACVILALVRSIRNFILTERNFLFLQGRDS